MLQVIDILKLILLIVFRHKSVTVLTLMFVGQHDKCVRQVTPPEETHDFGFHIAIWCLEEQQNSLKSSKFMIHK